MITAVPQNVIYTVLDMELSEANTCLGYCSSGGIRLYKLTVL
uniref:Uncharacterized protein n=1 Tax=Ciona intestinalis TaxID=7719 RepID=H2XK06_CIOIN